MSSQKAWITTDKLVEVEIDHLTRGKSTKTLCVDCLTKQEKQPIWLQLTTVTHNTPHTSCNLCGAITTVEYAKRFS